MISLQKLAYYAMVLHLVNKHVKYRYRLLYTIILYVIIKYIYRTFFRSKAKLYYQKNQLTQSILEKCPTINNKEFQPSPVVPTCILQTMAASALVQKNHNITFESEKVCYTDNNKDTGLRIQWPKYQNMDVTYARSDILIMIIPGVTGTIDDVYVNKFVEYIALVYQYHSVVFHYRMVGDTVPELIDKPFCLSQDLEDTINHIKKHHPKFKHIFAIGHSYGANQLVNYLGKKGENSQIRAGVSVCNPYCLVTAFRLMKGKIYDKIIVHLVSSNLKKKIRQFNRIQQALKIDLEKSIQSRTTDDVIGQFNRKMLGYDTIGHYQRKHSSVRQIHKVKVPLFGLSSEDDEVSHKRGLPKEEFRLNPNCMLMVTKAGGHVGYIESDKFLNFRFWYFQPCLEFLQSVIELQKI